MGKVRDPKVIVLDAKYSGTPEYKAWLEQGHSIRLMGTDDVDIIISDKAQYTPPSRLAYVFKKFKDITKELLA